MKLRFTCTYGAALAGGLGISAPAIAEVLPVAGIYPARVDDAAAIQTIAIENFGGDKGVALSFAITDRLENVVIEGAPYFQLVPTSDASVDAVMRGSAGTEALETELDDKRVTNCTKRDKEKKCLREEVSVYECSELNVTLYPRIRLIASDGTEIYSKRDRLSASEKYCSDESSIPSVESMLDGLVSSFAGTVRYDLAPVFRNQTFRILEKRKGLSKEDRKLFKQAVKLTKSDIGKSCEMFGALEQTNPDHTSILFNIGLCAEGKGDLDAAEHYYQRVLELEPGKDYPTSGLQRIADRDRAEAQLNIHFDEAEAAADAPTE